MEQPRALRPDYLVVGYLAYDFIVTTRQASPERTAAVSGPTMDLVYATATEVAPLADAEVIDRARDFDDNVPAGDHLALEERTYSGSLIEFYRDRLKRYQDDPTIPDGEAETRALQFLREDLAARIFRLAYLGQFDHAELAAARNGTELQQASPLVQSTTTSVRNSLSEHVGQPLVIPLPNGA